MDEDSWGDIDPHLALDDGHDPSNREEIISQAFAAMRAGSTLNAVALRHGVPPAKVWRWIYADDILKSEYEKIKIQRSQAIIEHALYEIQAARTWDEVKAADKRGRMYLMLAAKLNPKEFSDKVLAQVGRHGAGAQRVSFTLNFQGGAQDKGALTVIAQPEDGEE